MHWTHQTYLKVLETEASILSKELVWRLCVQVFQLTHDARSVFLFQFEERVPFE